LNIWKYFHITYPTALGVMSISSPLGRLIGKFFSIIA
jgi:hypothetical protein